MKEYQVVIIGGGGAGLTAALYTSRAKLSTALLEKLTPGGQIALTDLVENYPGFPEGILGPDISMRMEEQAKKYGTEVLYKEVKSIKQNKEDKCFTIELAGEEIKAKSIILAAGASFRMIGIPGEKELTGKGVSYCATCDGAFFKDKEVVVVGGGDSALQEGIFLTRFASKVTIIHRRDQLRASPILQQRAKDNKKIEFVWDTVVEEVKGTGKVEAVVIKNVKSGEKKDFVAQGIFIFIGHDPNSAFIKDFVELDEHQYVKSKDGTVKTSVPGVYAAGEIRAGATKQLVAACGEGCEAALAAQEYLEDL
jgi:thioredoxin reductase (NADPH)